MLGLPTPGVARDSLTAYDPQDTTTTIQNTTTTTQQDTTTTRRRRGDAAAGQQDTTGMQRDRGQRRRDRTGPSRTGTTMPDTQRDTTVIGDLPVTPTGQHPPNTRGMHPVDAAVMDADDALIMLGELRTLINPMNTRIADAQRTLTNLSALNDEINRRHQDLMQHSGTTTPPQP